MSGHAHFEIFDAKDGVRWRAQAANGIFTGHAEQSFRDDHDAERAIHEHVDTVLDAAGLDPAMPVEISIERVNS